MSIILYFFIGFLWWIISPVAEYDKGFRNRRIGLGVIGIYSDSLFEIFDAFPDTLLRPLVPVVSSLEVRFIGPGFDLVGAG